MHKNNSEVLLYLWTLMCCGWI